MRCLNHCGNGNESEVGTGNEIEPCEYHSYAMMMGIEIETETGIGIEIEIEIEIGIVFDPMGIGTELVVD